MNFGEPLDDVTIVIPFKRGGNEAWLRQAKGGFPAGQRCVVVTNDGEMAAALNDVITNHVETEWVYRFDADDVANPGLLHMLRDALWDGSDVAYPTMILSTQDELRPVGLHHADVFCARRLETHNFVTGAAMFRRSRFTEVGGYRDLLALEDWDLWLRMARAGARFKAVPDASFHYRQVGGSRNKMTAKMAERLAEEIRGPDPAADCVATFYSAGTPFSAQLRCVNPGRWLPAITQPSYFVPKEDHAEQPAIRFPHHRGAAIWQFGSTQMDSITQRWLQLNGYPLFLEVDDNMTVTGGRIARRAGWQAKVIEPGKPRELQQPSVEGHLRMVKSADGIICTTEYLAEQYRKYHANVWVCPNQVEPAEWPELQKPDDGVFRVGWFASMSHDKDWPLIRGALEWASRQKGVEVLIMGIEVRIPGFKYRYIDWFDDWMVYRKLLGLLDVGLAPVLREPWSLGRSDLKAVEYSMAGVLPILQDERPYEHWPRDLAFWAKTPNDWLKAVKKAVYAKQDARQLGAAAREYVLGNRTFEGNVDRWREAIASAERTAIAA